MKELRLMKGNEAIAEAAIRAGADAYFGYPITPQSEILEYLMAEKPWEKTGMAVLQAESEVAAINMVYGAAAAGRKAITSSSSPGISLKMEGVSYIAGSELPCVIVNVVRGGPGLGTIQPSQSDYFQATKGGGHGDYRLLVLAPASVQEMCDFVPLGFDLAEKYRNPVMILTDGVIGQMMEKVELFESRPRMTEAEAIQKSPWATSGRTPNRERNIITSLYLDPYVQEKHVCDLRDKYIAMQEHEVRFEEVMVEDAEYIFVAFGSSARICQKAVDMARAEGIKAGLLRPITLFPFPADRIYQLAQKVKGFLVVEMNLGQMVEDVKLAVNGSNQVHYFGRFGGVIPNPEEVFQAMKQKIIGG